MTDTQPPDRTVEQRGPNGSEHRVLDLLLILLGARRVIVGFAVVALLLGVLIAFLIPPTFVSTAVILPPQEPQSISSAIAGQLGSLVGLGGAGNLLKNPADTYVGMLQGRTIADHIIEEFQLQKRWNQKRLSDTRSMLESHMQFESAKDGLITISAKDRDPKFASDLANAFVDELYRLNSDLAVTEASQRRSFFDQQLTEERNALTAAENDLRATQEKTGLIELSGQSEMTIRSIAQTRAEIQSKEVQLEAMRSYATDQNPELNRRQRELDTLREQLARMENDEQRMPVGDTLVPAAKVPAEGLDYARKLREVKYHEALVDLLSKQYEAARIDEAKSAPIIQVVDRAVPTDRKASPPRMLIAIGSGLVGLCLGCFWVLLRVFLSDMHRNPDSAAKLNQLAAILHVGAGSPG